ncbi:MAG TPA: DUF5941 domain-containing protein [Trebonia sp.]|nr:DUF5941 domain-containing protein [Trebonia sp.]
MTAEELAPSRRAALAADRVPRDVARWASSRRLTPVTMAAFSVAFVVITGVWLVRGSTRDEAIALAPLLISYVVGRAGDLMSSQWVSPATEWARAGCAALSEFVLYAGIAGGASLTAAARASDGLTGPVGSRLSGTSVARIGAPGWEGVWRLAVAAMIVLALCQMAVLCRSMPGQVVRPGGFREFAGTPGGGRLLLVGGLLLIAGARLTFLLLFALGLLGLCAIFVGRPREARPPRVAGYRGDGPAAVWIGRFVDGRLPPLPAVIVGLLVTGMLAALGLQSLPGILVLTPVEAMLLASLATWHPHYGPRDWMVPPLLQAGEYWFLAALGFARHVPPTATFALLAAIALYHLDLAYRARNELVPSEDGPFVREEGQLSYSDRAGFGWDGRMIVCGLAAVAGIASMIYPLLALYLVGLMGRDWLAGWSAGHAAVDG